MSDLPPINQKYTVDTTDFKTGLASINREMRLVESEFRATAAALGDWGKSADGLEARMKALTSEIGLQEQKISALQGEYDRIAKEKGAASKAAQELQIKLNRETETLNKMKAELSQSERALEEMGSEAEQAGGHMDRLARETDEAAEKSNKLNKALDGLKAGLKAGALAIAGLAAAAGAASLAIGKLVLDASNAAGELVDLSAKTGISTTRLQELDFVGGQLGTDLDTMTSSLARMIRSMSDVGQSEEMTAAFDALGVSVRDSNGELRDSETVFGELLDALGGVENETERDALAMQILGRSAMELNPLIKAGSDEISRLTEEAHNVGAVMSEESVAGLESFGDELASLQAGLKGTLGELAAAFLPAFQNLTGTAREYLGQFGEIVRGADGDLGEMASGIGSLIGQMVTDLAAQAPQLLQAGLNILQGIINAIVTNLPQMATAAIQMLTTLVQFIVSNLPMLIETAVQLIVTLATGIAQALPELIPAIIEIIPTIITTLLENLPLLVDAALQLILALVEGLIAALPELIAAVPEILTALVNAIMESLPLIGEAAVELILALVEGIIGALPTLGEAVPEIVLTITNGMQAMWETIAQVGIDIVTGIWEGISSQAAWFGEQISGFFTGIVDGVKTALGIQSPSKVFGEIGENMALGLGGGFVDAFRGIERSVNDAVAGLSPTVEATVNARPGLAGAALAPVTVQISAVVASDMDMHVLARRVVDEIKRSRS
jgi:uncharacterized protein YoxC